MTLRAGLSWEHLAPTRREPGERRRTCSGRRHCKWDLGTRGPYHGCLNKLSMTGDKNGGRRRATKRAAAEHGPLQGEAFFGQGGAHELPRGRSKHIWAQCVERSGRIRIVFEISWRGCLDQAGPCRVNGPREHVGVLSDTKHGERRHHFILDARSSHLCSRQGKVGERRDRVTSGSI